MPYQDKAGRGSEAPPHVNHVLPAKEEAGVDQGDERADSTQHQHRLSAVLTRAGGETRPVTFNKVATRGRSAALLTAGQRLVSAPGRSLAFLRF